MSLPQGGGAIRPIGETFSAQAQTGGGSMSIPIYTSPSRSLYPELSLAYHSGNGNGSFGLGWALSAPEITRKTDRGLPQYLDAQESDTFILSGSEDLVPELVETNDGWAKAPVGTGMDEAGETYRVYRYRPRVEGGFGRIERWVHETSEVTHWRTWTRDNVRSIFGSTPESRIADPQHEHRVYAWRLDERRDDRGNIIRFQYKAEDWRNVDRVSGPERERWRASQGHGEGQSQRYLKRIFYGNRQANIADDWAFEVVFDYGDHSGGDPQDDLDWPARQDTFSSFRPGFDLRSRRLCQSVRMYHRFAELVAGDDPAPVLVRETKLVYDENPIATQLRSVQQFGYASESGPVSPEQSYPPTTFGYTAIRVDPTLRIVDHESRIHAPVGVDGQQYRLLDVDGEGLPGILTEQAGHWHYKSPLGEAQFARAQALPSLPKISSNAGGGPFAAGWQWMDLDGDGQRSLASITGPLPGYFERDALAKEGMEGETWQPYQSFRQVPDLDLRDPKVQLLDLNGDGFADILVDEGDAFVWYPSLGRDGFEAPLRILRGSDEGTAPQLIYGSPTIGVYFSDMTGDGLSDIVRVARGRVVYWPNLGYGRFGPEVIMADCPIFEGAEWFRVDRLRLGDVDGSGTTDFLYLGREGARLYSNQSGNGFDAGVDLPQLPPVTALESVELADLLGQGTSCLVWSSPRESSPGMAYLDLAADGKPYLLQAVDNGMGLQTRVQYASSTKYYLADKAAGQPWKTRLPFPVQVIEKVEVYDAVSRRRFSSVYRYRHGYFDGEEREFRGFGRVDQLDTEAFDAESLFEGVETQGEGADVEEAHYVAPVLSKTWFHTGALSDQGRLSRLYVEEYDQSDPEFGSLLLADTVAPEIPTGQPPLLAEELREAVRALRGRPLRVEVFSPDSESGDEGLPYLVTETNFRLQRLQPQAVQSSGQSQDQHAGPKYAPKHAVFLATEQETLSVHYERNPQDPRVNHKAVVEEDAYGTPLRVVSVVYPRRSAFAEHEEQRRWAMVLSELRVEHDDDPSRPVYRLAVPIESKRFELTAETESASVPLPWSQLRSWADEAVALAPEATPTAGHVEKRLLSWAQSYYYDEATLSTPDTASALPLGQLGDHALLFHTQVAAWSEGQWAQHIGDRMDRSVLSSEGGYVSREGYDWIVSGRAWWDPAAFYLLKRAYDPFFETTPTQSPAHLPQVFEYDSHHLQLVSARDALGNQVHAIPDYRVLAPVEVTDPNGNASEVQFDALGRVEAVALRGKNGEGDSLAEPTASFVYDAHAWVERGEAVSVRQRLRRQHGAANDGFEARVEYLDGGGNVALAKVQAEDGPAQRFDEDGNLIVVSHSSDRWVGTGRTVLDNKGNVIKQYEPYFVEGEQFDGELALTQHGVTPVLHYDPLGRNVRTDFPNQSFAKVAFSPWGVKSFDANDTVLESTWYERRTTGDLASEAFERQAAEQTEAHANTPSQTILDSQGRVFRSVEHNRVDGVDAFYTTRLELDIEGNPLRILSARSHADGSPLVAETRGYGMGGIALTSSSPEAGTRYAVPNVLGQALRQVDTRDGIPRTQRVAYDGLNRPVLTAMESGGQERILSVTVYGEALAEDPSVDDPEVGNHRGRVFRVYDGAGLVGFERYDFKGNPEQQRRELLVDATSTPDWTAVAGAGTVSAMATAAAGLLDAQESYSTSQAVDAQNRILRLVSPDGSITHSSYNKAGLLESVEVQHHSDTAPRDMVVSNLDYNEKGQRLRVVYGTGNQGDARSGTTTHLHYDPETFRLKTQVTTRSSDGAVLQDHRYTYDPVGNLTRIEDEAQADVYYRNTLVEAANTYRYDALYRLTEATGREHVAQGNVQPRHREPWEDAGPLPSDGQAMRAYTQQYDYDEVGNLLQMRHRVNDSADQWTRTYTYAEDSNRLLETSAPSGQGGTDSYSYDNHGNMRTMPGLSAMDWDEREQLQRTVSGTEESFYQYDAAGQRVRKFTRSIVGTTTTQKERIYVGEFELYRSWTTAKASPNERTESLHVSDEQGRMCLVDLKTHANGQAVQTPQPKWRYQLSNHLGSVTTEVTEDGSILSHEEYHPYGTTAYQACESTVEACGKRYRYSGKERDEETGLYYHGARYYAAWLGRWTAADPIGLEDGINRYAYVQGNPVNRMDPEGTRGNDPANLSVQVQPSDYDLTYEGDVRASLREAESAYGEATGELKAQIGEEIAIYEGLLGGRILSPEQADFEKGQERRAQQQAKYEATVAKQEADKAATSRAVLQGGVVVGAGIVAGLLTAGVGAGAGVAAASALGLEGTAAAVTSGVVGGALTGAISAGVGEATGSLVDQGLFEEGIDFGKVGEAGLRGGVVGGAFGGVLGGGVRAIGASRAGAQNVAAGEGAKVGAKAAQEIELTSEGLFPLFKEAEANLLKAQGTATQKAEFFQELLGQVSQKTGRSFQFTLDATKSGNFVFSGELGNLRVIDPQGRIFKGTLQGGGLNPVTGEPNFGSLTRIK